RFGIPPGCSGARRTENRVTARSKPPPEEVHRAALAHEAGTELLQHAVGLTEYLPAPVRQFGLIHPVLEILVERDRILDLDGPTPDPDRHPGCPQRLHHLPVELRDRSRTQSDRSFASVADLDAEYVVDEVEIDLEGAQPMRHRRGGEPPGAQIERHLPPVIDHRRA